MRKLLSAFALASFLMLGAGEAFATSYTCDGGSNPVPSSVTGDADINETGACTIGHAVSASGRINISAGGAISAQALTATTGVTLSAPANVTAGAISSGGSVTANAQGTFTASTISGTGSGNISITTTGGTSSNINISGNITAHSYNVVLIADGKLKAGTIDTSGTSGSHDIRLFPTQAGGTTQFVIGTSGVNGVAALTNNYTSGGIANVAVKPGGTGGIQVAGGAINVSATTVKAGTIVLDAGNGPVSLTGTLSANGATGKSAGIILINSSTLTTSGGAQITASDDGTAGQGHYVTISTGSISYSGGLTVSVNGSSNWNGLYLTPKGSQPVTIPTNPATAITVGALTVQNSGLTITGTGTLNLNASGPFNRINLSGYPLQFTGGAVTMTAPRSDVNITFTGQLNFGGGDVTIDTSTTTAGATAGNINIYPQSIVAPMAKVALKANGGGNGGNISVQPGSGSLKLGTNNGDFSATSNGGTTGNGGIINVWTGNGNITIDSAGALSAVAGSTSGDGGKVYLTGTPNIGVTAGTVGASILVDGKGSGIGGEIHILGNGTLDVGSNVGSVLLSAKNDGGTGKGGIIEIGYLTTLNFNGTTSVDAGNSGGNSDGGTINVHDIGTLAVGSATFNAKGWGNGKGGSITLKAGNTADFSQSHINAIAGVPGTGLGGTVVIDKAKGAAGQTLRVNDVIKVDGGPTMPTASFGGSIKLNNITCQQWKVDVGISAPRFWSCATPGNQTAVRGALATIPSTLKANISVASTYVFSNVADYNAFFATVAPDFLTAGKLGSTSSTLNHSLVFVDTGSGSGFDYTPYLAGNMMHEVAHLLDQNMVPTPSGVLAFRNAETATINAMTGATCVQVYGALPDLCGSYPPNTNPWDIFLARYITGQDQHKEMFADAFQNCSGQVLRDPNENIAQQSIYMKDVWTYMNTSFWIGCPRQE